MSNNVLSIRDLNVTFVIDAGDVHAVRGVSIDVAPGEVLALVGESGSGKTITAKSALRLLPDSADVTGAIVLDGEQVLDLDGEELKELRGTKAAMVFQEPSTALNPVYPVGWQIAEGLRAHEKMTKAEAKSRAIEILRKVGIPNPEERVDYYPHQFSGGQKQRIVIAMALVLNPRVIIADEPTTALDVTVQAEILDLLRWCRDEFGAAILLITHNMGVVADLADRVAVMRDGLVVETADVATLFAKPREQYTKDLLASVPRIQTKARNLSKVSTSDLSVVADRMSLEYPGLLGRPKFRAVDNVSFQIAAGEVVGLVGESGSGKTTIGRTIAGLNTVTAGSLKVLGVEMFGAKERTLRQIRRDIGFVFQDPASSFNPRRTIAECVAEPMLVHEPDVSEADRNRRVRELLEAVELPAEFAGRFPHELSGGQRQRVSFARALSLNPKLVIADEPTSALDVSVQATVLQLFEQLQRDLRFACLFITHDLAVVDQVSHRVIVLKHGRVVESGPTDQVLAKPQEEYTRALLDSLPIPDPAAQRAKKRQK